MMISKESTGEVPNRLSSRLQDLKTKDIPTENFEYEPMKKLLHEEYQDVHHCDVVVTLSWILRTSIAPSLFISMEICHNFYAKSKKC